MKKRNKHSPEFKKKVVLLAIKEEHTANEIANKISVHPAMVRRWKKEFLDNAQIVFEKKSSGSEFQQKKANSYLPVFIEDFNKRFSKPAKTPINAHKSIDGYDLDRIFTLKETRYLSKNLTLQLMLRTYRGKHHSLKKPFSL